MFVCAGEASLFTLSSSNAMVQMLGKGGPRVVAASIDSKRDLEQQLKACCESYILNMTKAAVEPMLGFITKVTAVRLAAGSNKALAKPLREQVSNMFNRQTVQHPGVHHLNYTSTHSCSGCCVQCSVSDTTHLVFLFLQAFAAPAKLAELVTGVNTAMNERLPPAVAKTRLYLPNPATRAILFRCALVQTCIGRTETCVCL